MFRIFHPVLNPTAWLRSSGNAAEIKRQATAALPVVPSVLAGNGDAYATAVEPLEALKQESGIPA